MNCECNDNSNRVKPRIKHVYGNVLRMAIPLTLRTLVKDGDEMIVTDTDFIPSSDHLVRVVLSKGKTNYPITATMDGNVAIIEDKGKIPAGTYDISVECYDDLGNPYRFKQNAVLYVADTTAEAGIDEEIEYEAQTWYLNAAVFLATTEIGEIGDVIDAKLDDVFGNVLYDANAKEIRFYNKGNSRVLATIDSRPFVVDGTVADVYIDVSRQVLVVVLNEDAGGRRFSVPLYLVFNSYYKKDEVDSLVSRTVENVRLDFSQELPFVVHVTQDGSSFSSDYDFGAIGNAIMEDDRVVVACVNNTAFLQLLVASGEEIIFSQVFAEDSIQTLLRLNDRNEWSMEDVDLGTSGGGGGYEPPAGGIPKSDLAQSVQDTLDDVSNKVDKVAGKGLSTEDYTTAEKQKLAGLSNYDDTEIQAEVDAKYEKPNTGIPKTDLASGVQASLGKADTALQSSDLEGYATTDDVDDAVAALVSSAPQTLDTLNELAEALGDDPNFATTMATQLGNKVDKETGKGLSTNDYTTAEKTKLAGLENYDDTAVKQRVSELESKKRVFIELTFDGQNRPWLEDQDDNMLTASEFMNIMNQPWLYDVQIYYQNRVYYYNLRISNSDSWEFWATENERKRYMIVERDDESSFGLNFEIHNDMINPSDINTTSVYQFVSQGEKDKLAGIAAGAQVNVQSDWNATSGDAKILNKPDLSTFATKTELAGKQGVINDLDAIRSGAGLGSTSVQPNDLADVATSGSYNDLADKPTIPAEQIQADWNQTSTTAKDYIKNKPTLANVATSGSYNDLQDKPNIPAAVTVDQTITQNGTNPVRGSAIYSALANKANINGSVDVSFDASTLQVCSNDESVMMNAVYRDDEMRLLFTGSVDGGSLNYTFDGSGSAKTIATTADIASCVPTTRKINNKPLSSDITLNASDVGAIPTAISTTYANLVTKTTNSQLTAGAWYRITDYTCTTTQTDTRSAGHQFDILVQATSPNTLSEEAKAIRHEGDTYFADANLEAWKIWYCLDNDTTRFTWADTTNGKGVIYRMIDEWNNDCPYDFKNIQFKRYKITATTKTDTWLVGKYMAATTYMAGHTIDANDFVWCYTFNGYYASWNQDDEYIDFENLGSDAVDLSKFNYSSFYDENSGSQGCARNVIPYHIDSDSMSQPRISLNNIVMYGLVTDVSTLPSDYEDLYGDLIFQMMSTPYSNTLGDSCSSNTFGSGCNTNTFGNGCVLNTFRDSFNSNTFGNYCKYGIFGNNCSSIIFGNNCNSNTFGNGCQSNTFGNSCNSNTLGNSCSNNTFGDNCTYNTFGNSCTYNTFMNYCQFNTFGDGCYNITFSKSYTQYVIVENGNMKITLTSTQTSTSSNPLRNITIAAGVNNTNTTKTISHNTLNNTFRTTYVATNSVEVQV